MASRAPTRDGRALDDRAGAFKKYLAHLAAHSTLSRRTLAQWMKLLRNRQGLPEDATDITLKNFVEILRNTQKPDAPQYEGLPARGTAPNRASQATTRRGDGEWFSTVLLTNADLLENVCRYLDMASAVALRRTCKLQDPVTALLRSMNPRLLLAGTATHFPHGRLSDRTPFVGIEKAVGVGVALAVPNERPVVSTGRCKWCVPASVAARYKVEGLRDRSYERNQLLKIELENGENWHSAPAMRYFDWLPSVRLELRAADTHEVVPGAMLATRSASISTVTDDRAAMEFPLGARYEPPARDGNTAFFSEPRLCPNGPSVATVYANFKIAHKLLETPYRGRRFYLSVSMVGKRRRGDEVVTYKTESRSEAFVVRRRAAAAVSESKKRRMAEDAQTQGASVTQRAGRR